MYVDPSVFFVMVFCALLMVFGGAWVLVSELFRQLGILDVRK